MKMTIPVGISIYILMPWRHPASSSIMDLEFQAGHGAMVGVENTPMRGELLQAVVGTSFLLLLSELGLEVWGSRMRPEFGKKASSTTSRVLQARRGAVKAVVVTAWSRQHGVTAGVQPALEGCRPGYRGAVVVDHWLVHGSPVEGQAAYHRTGLVDRARTGGQAYAGVMGRSAQAVVVIVEG